MLLTYLLESINNVSNKLCLVRLKKLQGRAANVTPVEGHEVATLKVLPVGEENDHTVLNLLHPAGKRVGDASVSGVLGNVSQGASQADQGADIQGVCLRSFA